MPDTDNKRRIDTARDIVKNAFLQYQVPETLRAPLKIIDKFEYDHSKHRDDDFEYLLSVHKIPHILNQQSNIRN